MDSLRFGTAGLPFGHPSPTYPEGLRILRGLGPKGSGGLGHMELEFVYGVRMKPAVAQEVKRIAGEEDLTLTAHGPYYINLNAVEEVKVQASITRILNTARMGQKAGAFSVTFHPAFYLKMPPAEVYQTVKKRLEVILEKMEHENLKVRLSPETTGKGSQFGSLEELVGLAEELDGVGLCIDFSHLHARSAGAVNTYDEFRDVLSLVENRLGKEMIRNMHIHLSGIAYTEKGERNHLILRKSDMNYRDLLRAFHDFDIAGAVVCESPNLQGDSLLLKKVYDSLK